jgi:hypothetical protein
VIGYGVLIEAFAVIGDHGDDGFIPTASLANSFEDAAELGVRIEDLAVIAVDPTPDLVGVPRPSSSPGSEIALCDVAREIRAVVEGGAEGHGCPVTKVGIEVVDPQEEGLVAGL